MKVLSVPMQSAVQASVTRPGYLIKIHFSPVLHVSSIGHVSWNGDAYNGSRSVVVSQLSADRGGTIKLGNVDNAVGSLILNNGIADRRIQIWAADAAHLEADDPVLVYDGVGDSAEIAIDTVTISLAPQRSMVTWSPRRFIGPDSGFTKLIPAGVKLVIGNTTIELERR